MPYMEVIQQFEHIDQTGRPYVTKVGDDIDIMRISDLKRLLGEGKIAYKNRKKEPRKADSARALTKTKRIGIFLKTSLNYSGGRIHMYQYAWCLGKAGAEVYLVTNRNPRWSENYPANENIKVIIFGENPVPDDLDIVITDSKGDIGNKALKYKEEHPRAKFICMNFETPNWVENYVPEYASQIDSQKEVFEKADFYMANSYLSGKYLLEWLDSDKPFYRMRPSINDYAIKNSEKIKKKLDRPYAVLSARRADYKGAKFAMDTIWGWKEAFDLVVFQEPNQIRRDTEKHKLILKNGINDAEKFALMRDAKMILCPSLFEGFGMVIGEGIASGKPVVAYDLPVIREEYGDLKGLYLMPWDDKKAFQKKMGQLAKRKVAVKCASEKVIENHGMEAMSREIDSLPHHSMKRPRVSVQMLCYWGFMPESIESVYPYVDEIIVAFGRVPHAPEVDDGSLDLLNSVPDPDNKIRIEYRELWQGGKTEMRQWCADQATGSYMLMLDGDEIWTGFDKWLKADIQFGCPRWVNFWHGIDHWIHDEKPKDMRWGYPIDKKGSLLPHYRWSWWRSSYHFERHPVPVDHEGNALHVKNDKAAKQVPECVVYHFGHALAEHVMRAKHEMYVKRDNAPSNREEAWQSWLSSTGQCGDGVISLVNWGLPEIVQRAYKNLMERQMVTT